MKNLPDIEQFQRLQSAVSALYYAAHWWPDRECDANKLWTDVRDAAGLTPGETTKRLGPARSPLVKDF